MKKNNEISFFLILLFFLVSCSSAGNNLRDGLAKPASKDRSKAIKEYSAEYKEGAKADDRDIAALIKALDDYDVAVKKDAAEALGKIRSPLAISPLARQLGKHNRPFRNAIIDALAAIGAEAVPRVSEYISSYDADAKVDAVAVLDKIGRPAVPHLLKALAGSRSDSSKSEIVSLLRRQGDAAGVEDFYSMVGNSSSYPFAAELLASIDDDTLLYRMIPLLSESGTRQLSAIKFLSMRKEKKAHEALAAKFIIGQDSTKKIIVEAWGGSGETRSVPYIIQQLNNNSSIDLVHSSVVALGEIGDKRGTDPLIKIAETTKNEKTVMAAIESLGKIGEKRALPFLLKHLSGDNGFYRLSAADAMGRIADPSVIKPLIAELESKRYKDGKTMIALIKALGAIGDPSAIEALVKQKSYPAAIESLGKIGKPALPALLKLMDERYLPNRYVLERVLINTGEPAISQLVSIYKGRNYESSKSAGDILAGIQNSYIAYNSGNALLRLGKYNEAVEKYNEAVKINPYFFEALNNLGVGHYFLKNYDKSLEYFKQALDWENSYRKSGMLNSGAAQYKKGDVNLSKNRTAISSESDSRYISPLYNLGLLYDDSADYENALKYFDTVIKNRPDDFKAMAARGVTLAHMGRHDEAKQVFNVLIAKDREVSQGLSEIVKKNHNIILQK